MNDGPALLRELSAEARAELERRAGYHAYLLHLYGAAPLTWMHGHVRSAGADGAGAGRYIHIRPVDDVVTAGVLLWLAGQCRRAGGTALDVLAWQYAPDLDAAALLSVATERYGVALSLRLIPREVMEPGTRPGAVVFRALPALHVETTVEGRTLIVRLTGYDAPPADLPPTLAALTDWRQWIDYWSVDFDYHAGAPFHNCWQTYRTRKTPHLCWSARHEYTQPGRYLLAVRVVDIAGCETERMVAVEIGGTA